MTAGLCGRCGALAGLSSISAGEFSHAPIVAQSHPLGIASMGRNGGTKGALFRNEGASRVDPNVPAVPQE